MTTFTENITETFHVVHCFHCALRFGIPAQLYRRVVTEAFGTVHCPACNKETGWSESADRKTIRQLESKLKWEMENTQRERERRERAEQSKKRVEASLIATKGVVTKIKKRVGVGVCPCCNRTFKQLSAHMAQKHPEFKNETTHT